MPKLTKPPLRQSEHALAVTKIAIETLTADPRNPRRHDRRHVRQIAKSIEAFGFNAPVLIDAGGQIIAGHGRVEAARLLGHTSVPTIELAHLSPEQQTAYLLADNKLTDLSSWDAVLLGEVLRDLSAVDLAFDLEATGFSVGEIDLSIEALVNGAGGDAADAPAPPGPAVTVAGDLWQLGPHRILCGNALDSDNYAQLFGEARARLVVSDPPYNVPIAGHVSGMGKVVHREFAMAVGEMSEAEFTAFLSQALRLAADWSDDGSLHYWAMDWRHIVELTLAARMVYDSQLNLCVWAKTNAGMGSFYRSQHELFAVFRNGGASHRNNVQLGRFGRSRSNVWTYPGANSFGRASDEGDLLAIHPTVKPVALLADIILDASKRGDIVFDPFLGSGSTLIAAEKLRRHCYGIELDPAYVDTAIRRWERWTGEAAVRVVDGRRFTDLAADSGARPDTALVSA